MTNKINGIDVSEWELKGVLIPITECKYFEGIGDCKEAKGLCVDNDNCYFKQLARLREENEELKKQLEFSRTHKTVLDAGRIKYKQALEEIRNIAEKLITETPEYNSCYYKDECGDNCTPKKQSKAEYCCYENVDKILTIINEVLK